MRRLTPTTFAVAAACLMWPSLAAAGGDSAGSTEDMIWVNPVATGAEAGAHGGAEAGQLPCTWLPIGDDPLDEGPQAERTVGGKKQLLFHQDCNEGLPIGPIWVPVVTAQDLIPEVEELLEAQLHKPTPHFEPVDVDYGWAYVQVPLDFRIEPGEWAPVEAYAEVTNPLGTVWVRATATPERLVFGSGDAHASDSIAVCGGLSPLAEYNAAVPGDCSYTYRNASSTAANGRTFDVSLTIDWSAMWVSSDPNQSGALTVGPTATAIPLGVAEAKALVSCTGSRPGQGGC